MSAAQEQLSLFGTTASPVRVFNQADSLDAKVDRAINALSALFMAGRVLVVHASLGKDSAVMLDLTLRAAKKVQSEGAEILPIIVMNGGTTIDNPEIDAYVHRELNKIESYANLHGIPLSVHIATPHLKEQWAVRIIGGTALPTFPSSATRDCTVNFKIRPQERLLKKVMKEIKKDYNVVPVSLLGTRFDESASREARMIERGDDDTCLRPGNGCDLLSPIARWSTDDVFEYLGIAASQGTGYSDFQDLLRIYGDAGGSSCAVVAELNAGRLRQNRPCGARTGCSLCTATEDKSMKHLLDSDERYGYMRGLNRLQRYLLATQYDWSKRQWFGRSIFDDGYVSIGPDAYSPAMLQDLLKWCLTLDIEEQEAATSAGLDKPRFQLITLEALIAIDATWSAYGFCRPFSGLKIFRDVYLRGKRYHVPEVETVPSTPEPAKRWLYVGNDWDENVEWAYSGLRDPMVEAFGSDGCRDSTTLSNGRTVMNVDTAPSFRVDIESAYMLLEFEMDRLIEQHYYDDVGSYTAGYLFYVSYGTIALSSGNRADMDRTLRRTAYKARHGLAGPDYDAAALYARASATRGNMAATDLFEEVAL